MRGPNSSITAWRNSVFLVFALSGLALASWVARIPAVRDGLQVNTAELGLLIFGISAGAVSGLLCAPPLLGRLGARAAMRVTLVVLAAGLALAGFGVSVLASAPLAFVGLAVFGFGNGALDVVMNLEGALTEKAVGRTLLPLMHGFFSLGTLIGAAIGAGVSALGIPLGWHFGAVAALTAGAGIPLMRFIPHAPEEERAQDPGTLWQRMRRGAGVWRDPKLLLIGAVMLGMAFAEGAAMDWIAVAAVDGHGVDNTLGALVLAVFVGGMLVGRMLGGPLIDRFGRVVMIRGSAIVGAAGVAVFIFASSPLLAVCGAMLWAVGCSLGFPVGMSAAADEQPESPTSTAAARVSVVAMVGYTAFLVGPPLLGWLGELFGILHALLVILGLLLLAAVCASAARETSGQFAER